LNDTRAYPSFEYVFNVGGTLSQVPADVCKTTSDDNTESRNLTCVDVGSTTTHACPHNANSFSAGAFQVWSDNSGKNYCKRIAGDVTSSPALLEWGLVDTNGQDPSLGVTLTMKGGDYTMVQFDRTQPLVRHASRRSLKIVMRCSADDSPLPTSEEVRESSQGMYEIDLTTVHGCPTSCKRTGPTSERLCAEHGTCQVWESSADASAQTQAECICDKNFYGPACEHSCTVSDCENHGVCGFDVDRGYAHCFCNSGYFGVDCKSAPKVAEANGYLQESGPGSQLAFGDIGKPDVPGNSTSEEAFEYCYDLCVNDNHCQCFSLYFAEVSLVTAQTESYCRFGTSSACGQVLEVCTPDARGWPRCATYSRPYSTDNSEAIHTAQGKAEATGAVVITMLVVILATIGVCFAFVVGGLVYVGIKLRSLTQEDDGYAAFDDRAEGNVGRALAPTAADGGRELEDPNSSLLSGHDMNFGANAAIPDFGDGDDESEVL
jgi:hypothetical protein